MPYALITKSSENWKATKSGDLNKLNTNFLFETDNEYGFPVVTSDDIEVEGLIPFHMSKKKLESDRHKAVHFFLDDYKFEPLWSSPSKYSGILTHYDAMITPTFSVWRNQPYALNLFNVYRSRWIARYYQEMGVKVLQDVRWADPDSYAYCFSGITKNRPIILNTVGTRGLHNRKIFLDGFKEMMKVLEPSKLYVYGEYLPVEFEKYFESVTYFDSFWKERRDKIVPKPKILLSSKE